MGGPEDETPEATVVIVTRNRREDLRRALESALGQDAHVEVLVADDGSEDGTTDMVSAAFPSVRVARFKTSAGLVVRRNEAAHLARGAVIVSLDDDAVFSTPTIVGDTLREFADPRVGAVAMPYADVRRGPQVHQRAPSPDRIWVGPEFRGTAHAVRRDVFTGLGGYRELIVHQGEEPDFCLRMLAAGYVVRLGTADPIHHFESPSRSFERMAWYGRRNELLLAFTYYPAPRNVVMALRFAARGLQAGLRHRVLGPTVRGFASGIKLCGKRRGERRVLDRRTLRLAALLRRERAIPLEDLELGPLRRFDRHDGDRVPEHGRPAPTEGLGDPAGGPGAQPARRPGDTL